MKEKTNFSLTIKEWKPNLKEKKSMGVKIEKKIFNLINYSNKKYIYSRVWTKS